MVFWISVAKMQKQLSARWQQKKGKKTVNDEMSN